jgi:hypothetical protein
MTGFPPGPDALPKYDGGSQEPDYPSLARQARLVSGVHHSNLLSGGHFSKEDRGGAANTGMHAVSASDMIVLISDARAMPSPRGRPRYLLSAANNVL